MLIMLSAAKPKISGYGWYKFGGIRTVKLLEHNRSFELELEKGEVFGVRLGKKYFYLVEKSAPKVEFRLTPKEARAIINKSKGWSGKVVGVKVKAGVYGKDSGKPDNKGGAPTPPINVSQESGLREDKALTSALKKVKFPGVKGLTFIKIIKVVDSEIYHFYDATSTLKAYRRKHGISIKEKGNWAIDIEEAIESQIPKVDAELSTVRFKGKLINTLSIIKES